MNKIVLLGDSITAGVVDGYPSALFTTKLRQALNMGDLDIINRGIPGDETKYAVQRLQADVLSANPDIVTIFFGTNDAANEKTTLESYKKDLTTMVEAIGAQKCILITPGITGPTRQVFRPLSRLHQYALATQEVAVKHNVSFLDWYDIAFKHQGENLLQADDIHYSQAGYDLLIENLVPLLKEKLITKEIL